MYTINEVKELLALGFTPEMIAMMTQEKPEIANANAVETVIETPVTTPVVEKKTGIQTLSREEFLAMADAPKTYTKKAVDYTGLDIMAYGSKMVKYNMKVNSNIWQYTDMLVRNKYNGRCSKYRGEFVWTFDEPHDRKNFLQCFQVKTEFTAEELETIRTYKKNKEVARAKRLLESVAE